MKQEPYTVITIAMIGGKHPQMRYYEVMACGFNDALAVAKNEDEECYLNNRSDFKHCSVLRGHHQSLHIVDGE